MNEEFFTKENIEDLKKAIHNAPKNAIIISQEGYYFDNCLNRIDNHGNVVKGNYKVSFEKPNGAIFIEDAQTILKLCDSLETIQKSREEELKEYAAKGVEAFAKDLSYIGRADLNHVSVYRAFAFAELIRANGLSNPRSIDLKKELNTTEIYRKFYSDLLSWQQKDSEAYQQLDYQHLNEILLFAYSRLIHLEKENKSLKEDNEKQNYIIQNIFDKLKFPIALRKMWSGGEVQEWINNVIDGLKFKGKGKGKGKNND